MKPDFIFYQSGVDILETDKLGRLGVSIEDCKKRDEKVLTLARENNIPVMASMGGGYSKEIKIYCGSTCKYLPSSEGFVGIASRVMLLHRMLLLEKTVVFVLEVSISFKNGFEVVTSKLFPTKQQNIFTKLQVVRVSRKLFYLTINCCVYFIEIL